MFEFGRHVRCSMTTGSVSESYRGKHLSASDGRSGMQAEQISLHYDQQAARDVDS